MKRITAALCLVLALVMIFGGCSAGEPKAAQQTGAEGKLTVVFIDVGQGDSMLVLAPDGRTMLVDSGERDKFDTVSDALSRYGVERLDAVVVTHPHTDHMGCMYQVIDGYDVGAIYMPDTGANTSAYEKLLTSIDNKGLKITAAEAGGSVAFSDKVSADILAPVGDEHDGANNWSVVIKLTYGDTSFLFTGDTEKESEKQMLKSGADLSADVLKVGHHGSSSSTSAEFLSAVSPSAAVIMCGKDNDYGHPHDETMEALSGIDVYRTDELGEITAVSDGRNVSINGGAVEHSAAEKPSASAEEMQVIGNKNSKVYHAADCGSLPKEANRVMFESAQEAEAQGYKPHSCIK